MSTSASALAQTLAQHGDEDIAQAVQLFISLRPDFRELLAKVIEEEPIPRYNGTVVSFNREKGFGFLQSDQVTAEFGKDAFCSSNEIGDFRVGSEVTFTVIVNKNNQPQARLLQGPDGSVPQFHGYSGEPPAKAPRVVPPAPASQWHLAAELVEQSLAGRSRGGAAAAAAGLASGRYEGTISAFFPERQFGFISCPQATAAFGRDVFLSSLEVGSFQVHDRVSFEVALNKDGKPQARNLQAPRGQELAAAVLRQPAGPVVVPPSSSPWTSTQGPAALAPGGEDSTRYTGTIVHFNAEKHFGFIKCEETSAIYNKDVFVSDLEIGGRFQIGDAVSFRVVLNPRGHPQAREVGPAGPPAAFS